MKCPGKVCGITISPDNSTLIALIFNNSDGMDINSMELTNQIYVDRKDWGLVRSMAMFNKRDAVLLGEGKKEGQKDITNAKLTMVDLQFNDTRVLH